MAKYTNLMKQPSRVQSPIPGKDMVENSTGGYVFQVGKWTSLERFLILGTEANTYYASARKLTKQAAASVLACAEEDFERTIRTITEISTAGRSFRNDAAIFAMALLTHEFQDSRPEIRQRALQGVGAVCRTASMFMTFQEYLNDMGAKWNRSRRTMTEAWYTSKDPGNLAYQTMKYRSRAGWSHGDLIKLGNFGSEDTVTDALLHYLVYGEMKNDGEGIPIMVWAFEKAKEAQTVLEIVDVINKYKVTWEFIPSEWLREPEVWRALLPMLPYTAMMRNLGRMTSIGVFKDSNARKYVAEVLNDEDKIQRGRVHPMSIMLALTTYRSGKGFRGSLKWEPEDIITDALEDAFYKAFKYVEPSGKRILVGLDVSSSMFGYSIANTNINAAEAAAAMSMSVMRTERDYNIMAFSHDFRQVPWGARASMGEILREMPRIGFGWTNLGLPIEYAMENGLEYDMILILTDNEVNRGHHVAELLRAYRRQIQKPVKFVTAAMVANRFTVADPNDPDMLDVVGFDAAIPRVISSFAKGEI